MSPSFDDLSRKMATSTSRRSALKLLAATGAAAAGVTILKPFRGDAVTCPAGSAVCGNGCCPTGGVCTNPASSCCCPKGTTPCGPSCCNSGVACQDRTQGLCGCPPRTTPCGTGANLTCCPAGTACTGGCPTAASFSTSTACITGSGCVSSGASAGNACTSNGQCCSNICGAGKCCNPPGTPCDFGNPAACCNLTCRIGPNNTGPFCD